MCSLQDHGNTILFLEKANLLITPKLGGPTVSVVQWSLFKTEGIHVAGLSLQILNRFIW